MAEAAIPRSQLACVPGRVAGEVVRPKEGRSADVLPKRVVDAERGTDIGGVGGLSAGRVRKAGCQQRRGQDGQKKGRAKG